MGRNLNWYLLELRSQNILQYSPHCIYTSNLCNCMHKLLWFLFSTENEKILLRLLSHLWCFWQIFSLKLVYLWQSAWHFSVLGYILVLTGLDFNLAFFLAIQYGIIKIGVRTQKTYIYMLELYQPAYL